MNSKKIESKRKSHGPGSERGGDPRKMPSRTINRRGEKRKALQKRKGIQKYAPTYQMAEIRKHGREGGKTRELVHTLHTLNFSLYALK